MAAGSPAVRVERDGAVLTMTLSRPHVRNAIDEAMLATIEQACGDAAADPSVAAVLVRGDGGFFSAGGDLGERGRLIAGGNRTALAARSLREGLLLGKIARLPQIVVAAVEGGALGLAFGIVAAADFVLAATPAVFGAPEVTIGAMPAQIAPFIIRRIGPGHARRLLLTGMTVPADEAYRLGIVHDLVAAPTKLDEAIAARLASLRRNDAAAVAATKRLLDETERSSAGYAEVAAASYADLLFSLPTARPAPA